VKLIKNTNYIKAHKWLIIVLNIKYMYISSGFGDTQNLMIVMEAVDSRTKPDDSYGGSGFGDTQNLMIFIPLNGVHLSQSRQGAHVYYQLFDSKMADGDQL
jgi:DNA transposition AAA+ family ATPase